MMTTIASWPRPSWPCQPPRPPTPSDRFVAWNYVNHNRVEDGAKPTGVLGRLLHRLPDLTATWTIW